MIINGHILEFEVSVKSYSGLLIIDIEYVNKQTNKIYINKQTNNIYINKQKTAKAGFNPNSIKNFINVKTTFKNIFDNLIQNITNLQICIFLDPLYLSQIKSDPHKIFRVYSCGCPRMI